MHESTLESGRDEEKSGREGSSVDFQDDRDAEPPVPARDQQFLRTLQLMQQVHDILGNITEKAMDRAMKNVRSMTDMSEEEIVTALNEHMPEGEKFDSIYDLENVLSLAAREIYAPVAMRHTARTHNVDLDADEIARTLQSLIIDGMQSGKEMNIRERIARFDFSGRSHGSNEPIHAA